MEIYSPICSFQLNPAHTVPTLVAQQLILTDSHAILMYLCDRFAYQSSLAAELWPKDILRRFRVTSFLFFDCTFLYRRDLMVNLHEYNAIIIF